MRHISILKNFHYQLYLWSATTWGIHAALFPIFFIFTACSNGDDINDKLISQAARGNVVTVRALIGEGADIHARRKTVGGIGRPALYYAAGSGNSEIVKLLVEHGANVNEQPEGEETALMVSTVHGYADIAKLLLAAGANVNARDKSGATALTDAARKGQTEIVHLLIEHGADVNVRLADDNTALSWARVRGTPEMVDMLLRAGARE